MKIHIHHGYIGVILIIYCILTINGYAVIGDFNIYIWIIGLVLGIVLLFHDLYYHLTHRKH